MKPQKSPRAAPPEPRSDDPLLAQRARGGDAAAFDELCRRHYPAVRATAHRLLGNADDAEDLAQECFVRAHRALSWYRAEASFASWLRRIVVHLARDRFRRIARRPLEAGLGRLELADPVEPGLEVSGRELERLLREALDALPEGLRIPLVLRTLEGAAYEEIALLTGVTPATARTQVMKARRRLHRALGPHLGGDA